MKIAWIGTGVMGKAMLLHLVEGGHTVSAYNRTIEKASDLKEQGAVSYTHLMHQLFQRRNGYTAGMQHRYFPESHLISLQTCLNIYSMPFP